MTTADAFDIVALVVAIVGIIVVTRKREVE